MIKTHEEPTTTMTDAERIAREVGNDGWDVSALDAFEAAAVRVERRDCEGDPSSEVTSGSRFVFDDGSAIVFASHSAAWDIEGGGPWTWQGAA